MKIKDLWIRSSAIQIVSISWTNLQNRLLWTVCLFGKRPVCIPRYDFAKILFCHNIILPKYDFAKISFCHNIVLPQYHFGIILPKYCFFQNMVMPTVYRTFPGADVFIDILKLLVSLCISGSSFVGSTKSLLKDDGSTGTITPCKWAKRQLESVDLQKDTKN